MMRIGELGKKADCLVQTVRFYESEGLLPEPARSEGNFRLYDEVHLQRLLFIRRCRAKDMTLDEIRQLLNLRDRPELGCGEVNALVDDGIEGAIIGTALYVGRFTLADALAVAEGDA